MARSAKVVKAFNTIFAALQSDPVIDDIQLDGIVASDDAAAKQQVLEAVRALGFRPIDSGPLAMARVLGGWGCSMSPRTWLTAGRGRPGGSCSAPPAS
jgi:predicted dinucleotide-binding enzyme